MLIYLFALIRDFSVNFRFTDGLVFSPVEVRDPSSSSSTPGSSSKDKSVGKESSSSKKGKKKATIGTCGIEEVVGSLGVGVSKPSAPDERDEPVESGPSTHSNAADQEKEDAAQVDDNDDLYVIEEGDDTEEAGDDVGSEADLRPRKKRRSLRKDMDTGLHWGSIYPEFNCDDSVDVSSSSGGNQVKRCPRIGSRCGTVYQSPYGHRPSPRGTPCTSAGQGKRHQHLANQGPVETPS